MKKLQIHLVIVGLMREKSEKILSSAQEEKEFRMLGDVLRNSELSRDAASAIMTPLQDILSTLTSSRDTIAARSYLEQLIKEIDLIRIS